MQLRRKRKEEFAKNRIKKLKKEIEKGDFEGLIVDRSKPHCCLNRKLTFRRGDFEKAENPRAIPEWDSILGGMGYVHPLGGNLDRPHSKFSERGGEEKEERHKRERREKQNP